MFAVSCLFFVHSAFAQISLDNVLVHLGVNERPVHNVVVGNSSDNPMYVTVELEAIPDPTNSSVTKPTEELLASPKTFSIEPHGQRTVRLLLKTPPTEKERVFRVSFVPQDRGFGEEVKQSYAGRSTVIRVLTGMGALVFADPISPKADLQWNRVGEKITFTNSGNLNVFLADGEACIKPGENCTKIPGQRVYAGATWEVKAPAGSTVTFLKRIGGSGEYEQLNIPAEGH